MALTIKHATYLELWPRVWQAMLWANGFPSPVAFIWYQPVGKKIFIYHTFTVAHFRREGLMRRLYDELQQAYPNVTHLITEEGTPDGGLDFLKAYGFKEQQPWGYVYEKPIE
jgi:hypothetical protein